MGVELIGKLQQKNGGTFKIVDLAHVDYDGAGASTKDVIDGHTTQIGLKASQTSLDTTNTRLSDIVLNVKNFGAKGDGTTDDTTAIQSAISSLTAGGTLFFPTGTYCITTLSITTLNHIRITGNHAVLKGTLNSAIAILNVVDSTQIMIDSLKFTYSSKPTAYAFGTAYCIRCYNYAYVDISKCIFDDFADIAILADESKDTEGAQGGTTSTPLKIERCLFINQTVSTGGEEKATAVYLGVNGEYSVVKNNQFRKVWTAIKGYGANSLIDGNTIMACTGTFSANIALIFFNSGGGANSAKVIISNNTINHNGGGATGIYCIGDTTRNERRYTIINNHILVHGSNSSYCIGIKTADGSLISGNYTVPLATCTKANMLIESSSNVMITGNTMQYVNGINCVASTIDSGNNVVVNANDATVKKIVLDATSKILSNEHLKFRFNDTAILGSETSTGVTVVRNSVGYFTLTHNIGNVLYVVTPAVDNSTTPYMISTKRTATTTDFYIYTQAGVLADVALMGTITL